MGLLRIICLLGLGLGLGLNVNLVLAQALADPAPEKKHYIIGIENITTDSQQHNSHYQNFPRDLLDLFAAKYGYTFSYKPLPLRRLFKDFIAQKIDFKYPDHPLWQQAIKTSVPVRYSDALAVYTEGMMVRPERLGLGIEQVKDISLVLGYTPIPYQQDIAAGRIRVWRTTDFQSAIKMVLSERVQGVYINITHGREQLATVFKQADALVYDPSLPSTFSSHYLSTIKYPKIIEQLNHFLSTEQLAVQALKTKHGIQ